MGTAICVVGFGWAAAASAPAAAPPPGEHLLFNCPVDGVCMRVGNLRCLASHKPRWPVGKIGWPW